jgi:hypothetical protein
MLTADGCTAPIPTAHVFGAEEDWLLYSIVPPARCHDCNVRLGHRHHPGCAQARCIHGCGQIGACDHDERIIGPGYSRPR